jgi:hypothetical protein
MLLIASWGKGAYKASSQANKCVYGLILLPTANKNEYRYIGVFYCSQGGEFSEDSLWNNRLFIGQKV